MTKRAGASDAFVTACAPAGAGREVDDVPLGEHPLALGRAQCRRAAEDDHHLLGAVMEVVDDEVARVELDPMGATRSARGERREHAPAT
jgi:hypothetical protein